MYHQLWVLFFIIVLYSASFSIICTIIELLFIIQNYHLRFHISQINVGTHDLFALLYFFQLVQSAKLTSLRTEGRKIKELYHFGLKMSP